MDPLILTIGYERLDPEDLKALVVGIGATVVDVRSRPSSGRMTRGFRREDLEALLGHAYEWRGDQLGGLRTKPTASGLERLISESTKQVNILLCKESEPAQCHRHHLIAVPLIGRVQTFHIFEYQVIVAEEVQRWHEAGGGDYQGWLLEEFLAEFFPDPAVAPAPPKPAARKRTPKQPSRKRTSKRAAA